MVNTIPPFCQSHSGHEDENEGLQWIAIHISGVASTINTNDRSVSKILFTVEAYI